MAGGVDGEKLCTTLLLSLLPPLVLVHECSESDRASLTAALFFFLPPCFFLGRWPPDVPTICGAEDAVLVTSLQCARPWPKLGL